MSRQVTRRAGDVAIAITLVAIGVAAVALASAMPAGTISQPGPRVFPTAVGVGLAVVAATLLAGALRGGQRETVEIGHRDALITIGMLALVVLAFERAGVAGTFAVFLTVLLRVLARLPWWRAAAAALASTLVAWLVFAKLLGVRLPWLPG